MTLHILRFTTHQRVSTRALAMAYLRLAGGFKPQPHAPSVSPSNVFDRNTRIWRAEKLYTGRGEEWQNKDIVFLQKSESPNSIRYRVCPRLRLFTQYLCNALSRMIAQDRVWNMLIRSKVSIHHTSSTAFFFFSSCFISMCNLLGYDRP